MWYIIFEHDKTRYTADPTMFYFLLFSISFGLQASSLHVYISSYSRLKRSEDGSVFYAVRDRSNYLLGSPSKILRWEILNILCFVEARTQIAVIHKLSQTASQGYSYIPPRISLQLAFITHTLLCIYELLLLLTPACDIQTN